MKSFRNFSKLLLCICATPLYAQVYDPYTPERLPSGSPTWMQEIAKNPRGVNFFHMDSLFEDWIARDVNARVKAPSYKLPVNFYRRWKKAYEPYVQADGSILLPTVEEKMRQLDEQNGVIKTGKRLAKATRASQATWTNIGPNKTFDSKNQSKDYQVCVYRLAVCEEKPNILYCGTEGGVVFKSTDKGMTWTACNGSHNFGGHIYAIAVHPHDENTVWVGGGNALWYSKDGGQTWNRQNQVLQRVNSIRIQANTISVSTTKQGNSSPGFYVSQDGGEDFALMIEGECFDHELKPGDPNSICLLMKGKSDSGVCFYKSENGGESFSRISTGVGGDSWNAGRLAVSNAADGQNYVYMLVTEAGYSTYEGGGNPHIAQSTDGGQTWVDKTSRVSENAWDGRNSFFNQDAQGGQGFFDMTLGASASDPKTVIFGLCSAYRSTQGGAGGWDRFSGNTGIGGYLNTPNMHPDIQDIVVVGNDTWIATDGGIKYSQNFFETPGEDRMNGIYAADYHGFDMGWNEDVMVGGRWHNGNAVHQPSYGEGVTLHTGGVERATGHVMLSNPRQVYFSDDGFYTLGTGITQTSVSYDSRFKDFKPYETLRTNGRIVADPRYAQRLIMNGREASDEWQVKDLYQMYESKNDGVSFSAMWDAEGVKISNYEFARSNPNVIYVSDYFGIQRSVDNGATFEIVESNPFDRNNQQQAVMIAVHPLNEHTVWAVAPFKVGGVKYTTDGGNTWTQVSDPLIDNRKFQGIILTGDEKDGVYLYTADGAYVLYKDNTMSAWMDYSVGLNPGMRITRMVPFYKEGKLRIGSNQGVWEAPLVNQDFRPVAQPMALNIGDGNLTNTPNMEVQFDSYSIVKQEEGTQWEWSFSPKPQRVSSTTVRNPRVVFGQPGQYDVTLKITTPSGKTHSRTIPAMIRINSATGITEKVEKEVSVTLLAEGTLQISTQGIAGDKIFTLHNMKGHLIKKIKMSDASTATLSVGDVAEGYYLYELKTPTYKHFGKIFVGKK